MLTLSEYNIQNLNKMLNFTASKLFKYDNSLQLLPGIYRHQKLTDINTNLPLFLFYLYCVTKWFTHQVKLLTLPSARSKS